MRIRYSLTISILLAAPFAVTAQVDDENSNGICSQFVEAIPFGSENNATLIANNDIDFFRVEVPGSGVLNAYVNAVLNAAFVVQVWDAGCNPIATATGSASTTANVYVLVCGGTYFVRVSRQSGTAPIAYKVGTAWDPECGSECDNTMATATPLASMDTTFQARLWGTHTGIAANTDFDRPQDQDFYRIEAGACGGVLNILVTNIPGVITLRASLFEGTPEVYSAIWHFQRSSCTSGNLTGAWILEANKTYFLRLYDETNEAVSGGLGQCGNSYDMAPNCFTVALDFESGCDGCGRGEANNTMATATPVPVDTTFETKLWGYNAQIAANTSFDRSEDQDFYRFSPDVCGAFNIHATNIPNAITLRATVFGPDSLPLPGGSFQRGSCTSGDLNGSIDLVAGHTYFLRIYDETNEHVSGGLQQCGNSYDMHPGCFLVTLSLTPANPTPPTITPGGSTAICPGACVTLTSSVADGNVWSTGGTGQSIEACEAGVYSVTAYDGQGCPAASLPVIVTVLPPTEAGFTVESIDGGDVTFANTSSNAGSYLWLYGDGSSSATSLPTHTHLYTQNSAYEVTLIAIGPCGQDTLTQVVSVTSVGIEDHHLTRFTLRPNPTNGLVVLNLANGMQGRDITVFDATGRVVLERSIANTSGPVTVDLGGQENGLYFVQVRFADGKRAVQRVVKE